MTQEIITDIDIDIEELCIYKNKVSNIENKMKNSKFFIGDKVKVITFIPEIKEYKIFTGVVTRDKFKTGRNYEYSVLADGLDRTEFDSKEMLHI